MKIFGKRFTRRGVSVVIAALLLIAIAVAAAVLLYVFSIGLLGSLSTSGGQQTKQQLIMEAYNWSSATLVLHLRNVGSANITLTTPPADFFVNGNPATQSGCTTLAPQQSCSASVTGYGFTPTSGVAYPIKVVTPDGAVFSYSAIYGQAS